MVATHDLTLSQIRVRCTDIEVAKYIASMPDLPVDISVCRLFAALMQSSGVAQNYSNSSSNAKEGDILDTYPSIPTSSEILKDSDGNIACHIFTYRLKVIIGANKRDVIPVYR